jgi:hypothetical protein
MLSDYLYGLCCLFSVELDDHQRVDEPQRYGAPMPKAPPLLYY